MNTEIRTNNEPPVVEFTRFFNEESPVSRIMKSGTGVFIRANKTMWVFNKKEIPLNTKLTYDDEDYLLVFVNRLDNGIMLPIFIPNNTDTLTLYNSKILPRRVKKGDTLGYLTLIKKEPAYYIERGE